MITDPPVKIEDYPDVEARAVALGCNVPIGIALLPRNFARAATKEELLHEDTAPTERLPLREKGIEETRIDKDGDKIPLLLENGFEWIGPTLFIGGAVFSSNPHVISVARKQRGRSSKKTTGMQLE